MSEAKTIENNLVELEILTMRSQLNSTERKSQIKSQHGRTESLKPIMASRQSISNNGAFDIRKQSLLTKTLENLN
jgi:hypothetical protein